MKGWPRPTIRVPVLMTWRQYEAYQRCMHDESTDPEDPAEAREAWCREVATGE